MLISSLLCIFSLAAFQVKARLSTAPLETQVSQALIKIHHHSSIPYDVGETLKEKTKTKIITCIY